MELKEAAIKLEALGNPTRLAIYNGLVQAGDNGSTVGDLREYLDIPASTFSHHIARLVNAGLLTQERESRSLICRANHSNMDALMEFLVLNCCAEDWYIQSE